MCASVRNKSILKVVCSCLYSGVLSELIETEVEEEQAVTEPSSCHHHLEQYCVLWLVAPTSSELEFPCPHRVLAGNDVISDVYECHSFAFHCISAH